MYTLDYCLELIYASSTILCTYNYMYLCIANQFVDLCMWTVRMSVNNYDDRHIK